MNEIVQEIRGPVSEITINRAEQRNALNREVLVGLKESLSKAIGDARVRVVTITGSGEKVFCAGADLKASLSDSMEGSSRHFGRSDFRELLLKIMECPKPTVALARGHVMAGGLGLLMACDLTLACDDIHFSTPEVQVGMFPMMVLALLFRNVGRKKGTEMLFLGERISAREAMEIGLVNHVFPRAEFDRSAAEFVAKLAERSPTIIKMGKKAMRRVEGMGLRDALEHLEAELTRLMGTEDSKEGMRAFAEKRTPRWKD